MSTFDLLSYVQNYGYSLPKWVGGGGLFLKK